MEYRRHSKIRILGRQYPIFLMWLTRYDASFLTTWLFFMDIRVSSYAHWSRTAVVSCENWLELSTGLCPLSNSGIVAPRAHALPSTSALGIFMRLYDYCVVPLTLFRTVINVSFTSLRTNFIFSSMPLQLMSSCRLTFLHFSIVT